MKKRIWALVFVMAVGGCGGVRAGGDGDARGPATSRPTATVLDPHVGGYSHDAAQKLYREGKYAEDEALCKGAIAELEKTMGDKAPELAAPLDDLATVYLRQSRFAEAKPLIDRAESVLDEKVPAQALLLGRLSINKGWRLYSLGEEKASEDVFEKGRALLEKNGHGPSVDLAEVINNMGLYYDSLEEPTDDDIKLGRKLLFEGWAMRRRLTGDYSAESGESLNNIGMHLLFHAQDDDEAAMAMETLKKSLEVAVKVYGADHPETASAHTNLALAYVMGEEFDKAEKEIRIALPMTEKYLGKESPDRAYELDVLGQVQEAKEKFDEAEKSFTEAVDITQKVYGKNHPHVLSALKYLESLYEAMGEDGKLKDVQRRMEAISGKDL